jgi:hypothetical protein
MFAYTDIKEAPWYLIETDNKRSAHLNLLNHLLSLIPYKSVPQQHIELPPRQERSYKRPLRRCRGRRFRCATRSSEKRAVTLTGSVRCGARVAAVTCR